MSLTSCLCISSPLWDAQDIANLSSSRSAPLLSIAVAWANLIALRGKIGLVGSPKETSIFPAASSKTA